MTNSGLTDLTRSGFRSVYKMLSGKNLPQNLRALRMIVEEILHSGIDDMIKFDDLTAFLQTLRKQSPTSILWVDNLIRPVFYKIFFVHAEREGDWPLHLYVVSKIILYSFPAGHQNYARYGLYYLHDMKKIPVPS